MFEEVLSKSTEKSLALLSKNPLFKKAYLAGGTALALQLGHRIRPRKNLGINIADMKDIAAMKIASISDRGTKRDFVDLYFLLKNKIVTLQNCLDLYDQKFKKLQQNKVHILKSLTYFADAEKEKMPPMSRSVSWKEIKKFLERETKQLTKTLLVVPHGM